MRGTDLINQARLHVDVRNSHDSAHGSVHCLAGLHTVDWGLHFCCMSGAGNERSSSHPHGLSEEELGALLGFLGYGNPAGRFWFLGIEERGVGDPETLWRELHVRAAEFQPIEDLKRAQEHPAFGGGFSVSQHVPTWAIMSKIVLRLSSGDLDWSSRERVSHYQAKHLGRTDCETFLADLLPLPTRDVNDWPYPTLFDNKELYRSKVLPRRFESFRTLLQQHSPDYVFCYGKSYWDEYRMIFPGVSEYEPVAAGAVQVGRTGSGTLVVLTPFFASYLMGHNLIDAVAARLREDRFTWHDGDVTFDPPLTF